MSPASGLLKNTENVYNKQVAYIYYVLVAGLLAKLLAFL